MAQTIDINLKAKVDASELNKSVNGSSSSNADSKALVAGIMRASRAFNLVERNADVLAKQFRNMAANMASINVRMGTIVKQLGLMAHMNINASGMNAASKATYARLFSSTINTREENMRAIREQYYSGNLALKPDVDSESNAFSSNTVSSFNSNIKKVGNTIKITKGTMAALTKEMEKMNAAANKTVRTIGGSRFGLKGNSVGAFGGLYLANILGDQIQQQWGGASGWKGNAAAGFSGAANYGMSMGMMFGQAGGIAGVIGGALKGVIDSMADQYARTASSTTAFSNLQQDLRIKGLAEQAENGTLTEKQKEMIRKKASKSADRVKQIEQEISQRTFTGDKDEGEELDRIREEYEQAKHEAKSWSDLSKSISPKSNKTQLEEIMEKSYMGRPETYLGQLRAIGGGGSIGESIVANVERTYQKETATNTKKLAVNSDRQIQFNEFVIKYLELIAQKESAATYG